MEFRVYNRKTFQEITHKVRMGGTGEYYINDGDLPLNRLKYFIQWTGSDKLVRGDGDWETFKNNSNIHITSYLRKRNQTI